MTFGPVFLFFFYTRPIFSERSISAAITSWKDFRAIAPTYFFMGNPFPIDLRVFEHSIDRLHGPYVARFNRELAVIQWTLWKLNETHWNPYKSSKINNISENSSLCSGLVMTLTHSNRSIECSNTRKSIGNGFPMKKYVGAMVRKSFQLVIAAEIDHSENIGRV